jgi:D-beta-D-heptose 7-phosphate kinase/D-beta-D-heptose 1-phosphate adenosyltransferase
MDGDGAELRNTVELRPNIDVHLVERLNVPTAVKTRIIAHNQQVVRVDQEVFEALTAETERDLCDTVSDLLPQAEIVVVSDYQKGTLSNAVLQHITSAAKEHGVRVIIDPKGKDFSKYAGATMITPNKREASVASQFEESDDALVAKVGRQLISALGLEAILITRSEEGMSLFVGEDPEVHLEAMAKEIYDVTGAGDTVIATLAVAIASGLTYAESASIANVAAGIVVQHIGTSTINIDELAVLVRNNMQEGFEPANAVS